MARWNKLIIGEAPMTGPVDIDIDFLEKNWDDKCVLMEWRDGSDNSFRFMRFKRIGRGGVSFKFTISNETAVKVIERLDLRETSGFFESAYSWRKPGVTELSLIQKYVKKK